MYSIQIALFERKIYYVVKFHFSFFFRILIKEFLLKIQIFKALLLKIYIYAMFVINGVFLLLQLYSTIFKDALLRLF